MTHEELLERVNEYISGECDCGSCNFSNAPYKALRAVVELHQPIYIFVDGSNKSIPLCIQCRDGDSIADYPCNTIQNIERELM